MRRCTLYGRPAFARRRRWQREQKLIDATATQSADAVTWRNLVRRRCQHCCAWTCSIFLNGNAQCTSSKITQSHQEYFRIESMRRSSRIKGNALTTVITLLTLSRVIHARSIRFLTPQVLASPQKAHQPGVLIYSEPMMLIHPELA